MNTTRGKEFLLGLRDYLPLLPGDVPFALVLGAVATSAGLSPLLGHSMSYLIFAGSAQLILAQLIGAGAPAVVLVATAAVVNLRHMLYSATLAPHWQHLPLRWKALLAYLLTDEAFAVSIQRVQDPAHRGLAHWHFFGAGSALWLSWQLATLLGFFVGATLPQDWPLDFAPPVTFIALLIPVLKNRPALAAAAVGGAVAVACAALPYKLGLLLAAFSGILAGVLAQRRAHPRWLGGAPPFRATPFCLYQNRFRPSAWPLAVGRSLMSPRSETSQTCATGLVGWRGTQASDKSNLEG